MFIFSAITNPKSILTGEAFAVASLAFKQDVLNTQQRIDKRYANQSRIDVLDALAGDYKDKSIDETLTDLEKIITKKAEPKKVDYRQLEFEKASLKDRHAFFLEDKEKEVFKTKKWIAAGVRSDLRDFEIKKRAYNRLMKDVDSGRYSKEEVRAMFDKDYPDLIYADDIIFDVYADLKKDGYKIDPVNIPQGMSHREYISQEYAYQNQQKAETQQPQQTHKPSQDDDDYGYSGGFKP